MMWSALTSRPWMAAITWPLSGIDLTDQETVAGLVNVASGLRWETIAHGEVATCGHFYRMNVRTTMLTT